MAFRRILVMSKLFTTSWGHPRTLNELLLHKRAVTAQRSIHDFNKMYATEIKIEKETMENRAKVLDASFLSPYGKAFPHQMEGLVAVARMRVFLPENETGHLVIHLAGTGDHSYFRRKHGLVVDLLRVGVASVLLENPFYSTRKPLNQFRSSLHNVSDLFVMGGGLISECNHVIHWARTRGYHNFCISGTSMGAYMACLTASNAAAPLSVVPALFSSSAARSYTEGALREAINWPVLDALLRDPQYTRQLDKIPQCDWVEQMHEMNKKNGEGLAMNMMRVLMDEFTHLRGYPLPFDTSLVHGFVARKDGYIVQRDTTPMQEVWPGMTLSELPGGHVSSYLFHHGAFRKAISGRLNFADRKYPHPGSR